MTEQTPTQPSGPSGGPHPPPYSNPPQLNTYALPALLIGLFVLPPVGIWLGYKAKQQIAQTGERGIELANVAIIVGWILTGLWALFMIVWCGFAAVILGGATFGTL